jgi:thiopeptide-type bacteriocin biosynthesis protein
MRTARPGWVSYHVFLEPPLEPFLLGSVLPFVRAERQCGRLRRFFFIRYSEEGLHLRLRFLPSSGVEAGAFADGIERALTSGVQRRVGDAGSARVERHPYERAVLYFGHSAASTYAELLNEATSWLVLGLLSAAGGDEYIRRWLSAAAVLQTVLRLESSEPGKYRSALRDSRDFARRTAAAAGLTVGDAERPPAPELDGALIMALTRLGPRLAADPALHRIAWLLRRARRAGGRGPEAAVHALHLLCNKLGLSLPDEYGVLSALLRLNPATVGSGTRQFRLESPST